MGRLARFGTRIQQAYAAGRDGAQPGGPPVAAAGTSGDPVRGDSGDTAAVAAPAPAPAVPVPVASPVSRDDEMVPRGLRLAAAYSWRLLMIAAATVAVLWVVSKLRVVFIPLAVALLLTALFSPLVRFLRHRARLHRSLATALVLIGGAIAVAGVLTLVVTQFINGFPDLQKNAVKGIRQIQDWLRSGPLHLSDSQVNNAIDKAQAWVNTHQETLTSGALATATTVLELLAGMFLVLFSTFFFLRDGDRIWYFVTGILPGGMRPRVADAGVAAWRTLTAYVRATVLVAFIDAVGIGIWLAVWRVEFAFPLAALVFLGAFIPIVGATLSGTVAVLVALVTRGPVVALIILAGVIGIQQLEGHLLQPLIMGRAVAIHPLAVIVAIATGAVLAGIVGALVAVPIVAVLNTAVRHLRAHRAHEPPPSDSLPVVFRDEA